MEIIVLVHAFATLSMVGVIWFVQIVHYPLMGNVGRAEFPTYEQEHQRRTTLIIGPLMLVEAATAMLLPFVSASIPGELAWLGAALLAVLWASTLLWQALRRASMIETSHLGLSFGAG